LTQIRKEDLPYPFLICVSSVLMDSTSLTTASVARMFGLVAHLPLLYPYKSA
jgi:hypothetical protein